MEGRLEITEVAECTLQVQLERERADLMEEEAKQLRDELQAERATGFWARLFRAG